MIHVLRSSPQYFYQCKVTDHFSSVSINQKYFITNKVFMSGSFQFQTHLLHSG
uniref:Uncharacterized protein n=1 Tax=Arion vulgaris TaxID=1028688 RepID=A0A0B7AMU5_9EUPU